MANTLGSDMDRNALLELLDEKKIREYLDANGLGSIRNVDIFSSISSTNDYLLESAFASKQVSVCLSEHQTRGRGRYGHQWVSPNAANLYISMSWPFKVWKQEYETLSLWLLISIAELLERYNCSNIQLKWPNDLCVNKKKLAGVLIERKVNEQKNVFIIGVGLNVAMSLHNNVKIDAPWIDLLSIKSDWGLTRNELAANVISSFYNVLVGLEENQLVDLRARWQTYDILLNNRIEFLNEGKVKLGIVKGIDDLGNIALNLDGELVHMHSAYISEIKIIGNI